MAKTPVPVLAERAPEPGEKPPEPTITIAEVKPPGVVHAVDQLERAGDMKVEEFVPTAADLARLAKPADIPPEMMATPSTVPSIPQRTVAERMAIIPPSVATRTLAEMEAGRRIVEQKTRLRNKALGLE
jgi:hypothetical protein